MTRKSFVQNRDIEVSIFCGTNFLVTKSYVKDHNRKCYVVLQRLRCLYNNKTKSLLDRALDSIQNQA